MVTNWLRLLKYCGHVAKRLVAFVCEELSIVYRPKRLSLSEKVSSTLP